MKKKPTSSSFFNLRILNGLLIGIASLFLAVVGFNALSRTIVQADPPKESDAIGEDPATRMAWERLRLQDEHGRFTPDALWRAYQYKKTMPYRPEAWAEFMPKNATRRPEVVQTIWTSIGPGNIGGRTRAIIIHPSNPDIMWLGGVGGGVWKTTDGGGSWNTNTDFLSNLAVDCMVMDPSNSNTLFAGTGEPFPFDGIRGNGIFKTLDGGSTWIQLSSTTNNPDFYDVTRLAARASRFTSLLAATTTGLFRSDDAGATWSSVKTGPCNTVVFQPNNPANCLSSFGYYDFEGVFYSTDYGSTWTQSAISSHHPLAGRVELAYAASNPNTVYASATNVANGELLKSTDGGHTFNQTNVASILSYIGWYANTLWIDPTDPSIVVAGGQDLYRTTDGGNSAVKISGTNIPNTHLDHHVVINPPNYGPSNRTVLVGSDGGIRKTTDILVFPSPTWTSLNHTLGITQFYGGAASSDGSTIIGGTQDNGTIRYTGNREGWDFALGGDGGDCAAGGGYFYGEAATYGLSYLWRSSDGSSSNLQYINPSITTCGGSDASNAVAPIILDPNNSSTLLAGTSRLWRSKNANTPDPSAVSWSVIKCPQQGDDRIGAIAVALGDSDIVWVGHNSGNIYRTANGNSANPTWVRADTAPLPDRYCESIAFPGQTCVRCTKAYVALGAKNYVDGFNADNLWKTTDNGQTWTNISNGLPNAPILSVVASQLHTGYLYIGTAVGVFASADDGAHWSPGIAGDVPANVFVDQLFWTNGSTRLVAVTHGRGVFTANTQ